jgi:predicted nucleotidyltransferase
MASRAAIEKVKDFARQVNSCGITLKRVVLFGSYARDEQTKYSDIDIALVADDFTGVPSEDVKLFLKALRKHYTVQAQTYNPKQFTAKNDPFVGEILRTGIEVEL